MKKGNRGGESFAMIENAIMNVLIPVSSRGVKGRGDPWMVPFPLDIRHNDLKQIRAFMLGIKYFNQLIASHERCESIRNILHCSQMKILADSGSPIREEKNPKISHKGISCSRLAAKMAHYTGYNKLTDTLFSQYVLKRCPVKSIILCFFYNNRLRKI